jgi:predicted TIM-barrel fold metal-dependent hydrolase
MSTEHEQWLNQIIEEPLDPLLPICDAHHHLWYSPVNNYTVEDLLQDFSRGHNIRRTIFIESRMMLKQDAPPKMQPVGETEFISEVTSRFLNGTASTPTVAAGIIGFADLITGASVAPVLEAHIYAGKNRFRGIRYITAWDASPELKSHWEVPPGLLMDKKFREGFAMLHRYNLSFDAWLYHTQLMELVDLAREFPYVPIIINHAGGPLGIGLYATKRETVFREWKQSISELSSFDNVYIKLGGLGMRICGYGWNEKDKPPVSSELARVFEPYYMWCIERFGVDRCMFESNFPVDKASYSYTVLWNAFKRMTKQFSYEERLALFHDTASAVYRLNGS